MPNLLTLLKNGLVTGLLLITPLGGTVYLSYWLITSVDGLFPASWRPVLGGLPLPGLGLGAVVVLALIVGLLARNFVGRRIVRWLEVALQHIPLVGGTYGLIKQVMEGVFSSGGSFKRAVLVEYPHPGSWAIAFVTQTHAAEALRAATGDVMSVFVPTCPNPTSGFFLLVERTHVREIELPIDQAFKLVLSMGIAHGDVPNTAGDDTERSIALLLDSSRRPPR